MYVYLHEQQKIEIKKLLILNTDDSLIEIVF
jgi:hypothetical protein